VIDIETTGLDPRTDDIVSFAAVPVERGRIVARDALHGLVRPAAPTPRSLELLWRLLIIERGEGDHGACELSMVASALDLPAHRPHEAESDALTTAQAFPALATHLESHGRGTVRALTGANWLLRGWRLWHGAVERL
jgi:DNA polymerase III epsilon subunit-like protein